MYLSGMAAFLAAIFYVGVIGAAQFYRVPPPGWRPPGWVPPTGRSAAITAS